jgi:hypothetical protein
MVKLLQSMDLRQRDFRFHGLRFLGEMAVGQYGHRGKNPDDHDHDHQLDERETLPG